MSETTKCAWCRDTGWEVVEGKGGRAQSEPCKRCPATPPTPDLDAVREAFYRIFELSDGDAWTVLRDWLGVKPFQVGEQRDTDAEMADTLMAKLAAVRPQVPADLDAVDGSYEAFMARFSWHYHNSPECQQARKHSFGKQADAAFALTMREYAAAVSRPAEARGEPDSVESLAKDIYLAIERFAALGNLAFRTDWNDVARAIATKHTHPAPSGGEGDENLRDDVALQVICRAFEDWEPVWQRWLAYDKSQWLWWGRALGGFLALEKAAAPRHAPSGGEGEGMRLLSELLRLAESRPVGDGSYGPLHLTHGSLMTFREMLARDVPAAPRPESGGGGILAWHIKGVPSAPDAWTTHEGYARLCGDRARPICTPDDFAEVVLAIRDAMLSSREPDYWIIVDSSGELEDCCESEQSANESVASANAKWKHNAPFRAIPVYTRPAAANGEGEVTKPGPGVMDVLAFHRKFNELQAAPRPEPGEPSEAMVEAATALVKKLELIHDHPSYQRVFQLAHLHFGAYDGPQYDNELNALRAALAAQREQRP